MESKLLIPLLPGDGVDRYRVEDFVAEGGMGQVFSAWDTSLERRVALKVVRADHASEQSALLRFQREAQILARLNHPGICQVYDWLDHQGRVVMAMEWVEGEPLSAVLERGPLPVSRVLRLMREVAEALGAAHAKGVIHRDLKPSNIMLTPTGGAKLLDFGLAKSTGDSEPEVLGCGGSSARGDQSPTQAYGEERTDLTQPGMIVGTRGYLAPEVLLGVGSSPGADLYALGVIAAMALTGERHLPRWEHRGAWVRRLLKHRDSSGAQVAGPRALWALVDRLLATDPAARPSAPEVARQLDRLLRPASPVRWAALTAVLTLLASGLGFWAYARGVLPEFSEARKARLVVAPIRNLTSLPALDPEAEIVTTDLLEHALRTFPKIRVVPGRGGGGPGWADAEGPLLAGTGADLVLVGEVAPDGTDADRKILRVRLLDARGKMRASGEAVSRGRAYEPELAVPTLLQGLGHELTPLGRPLEFPSLPSREALEAYSAGLAAFQQGQIAKSVSDLDQASHAAPRYAPAVMKYAKALALQGDPRAGPTFMWARTVARETHDRYAESECLIGLAMLARREDRHSEQEVPLFEEALRLAEANGDLDLQAIIHNHLGYHWITRERWDLAEKELSTALEKTSITGNRGLRASVRIDLASKAKYLHDPATARSLYAAARDDAESAGNPLMKATTLINLAILDLDEGHPEPALKAIGEVLALRTARGDVEGEHRARLLLGIAAYMLGDLGQAAGHFETTLKGARVHGMLLLEGRALYRLGDLLRTRGDLPGAAARLRESLGPLRKKGTPQNQAEALATLAECRARLGHSLGARRLLQEAERLAGRDTPHLLRARAWLDHLQGRDGPARTHLEAALAMPRSEDPEHQAELRRLLASWKQPT